jgi:O-antigen ligase
MHAFAWGYVLIVIFCFMFGSYSDDSRYIVANIPALGNPNDLALHLMIGAAFLMVFASSKLRVLLLAIVPAILILVLRTGSRSNMLALGLVLLICLKLLPGRQRIQIIAGLFAGSVLVAPFLPSATLARLGTFFGVTQGSTEAEQSAALSAESRKELQKQGLIITLHHPIFGVGPEMFRLASDLVVRAATGHRSGWQGTHNTYLQVSSETGIPGLIFFAGSIFLCIRLNYQTYRAAQKEPALKDYKIPALSLLIACSVYAFDVLFSHIAYDYHVPVLVGFTASNYSALQLTILRNSRNKEALAQVPNGPPRKRVQARITRASSAPVA